MNLKIIVYFFATQYSYKRFSQYRHIILIYSKKVLSGKMDGHRDICFHIFSF